MRILVTGITGRIGANLAAALVAQGHAVRGLVWARDARVEKLRPLGVELVEGNLTEPADVDRAVDGVDAIYHLGGAFQGGGPFSTDDYFAINVRGTYLMLEAAQRQPRLQQFLFASTDALYDKYPPGGMAEPIDPDRTPRRPRGWYALSKSLGEELCDGYWRTYRTPVTILRFALTVGAGEIAHFPQFYLSKLKETYLDLAPLWSGGERLVIMRDLNGRSWRKHIADVRDIVGGCLAALGKPAALGQTFQLAGPAPFTWEEAIPYLADRLGLPYVDARSNGVPTYYEYDLEKARRLIDFRPQYDIFRMIDDAVAFERGEEIGVLPTA
jgi:UDP-glucose 4-epimerase